MRSEKQLVKLVEDGWLQQGEKLQRYGGGNREQLHFGATIAGRHQAPYRPSHSHDFDVDFGEVLYPTELVQQGRFHGDEWVHDPTIRGWIQADSPGRVAVECADLLVAVGPEAWFIGTDRRIAVVADAAIAGKPGQESALEAGNSEESAKGFGRLFGKARSAMNAVAELSESLIGGTELVTLWECPREHLGEMTGSLKGRSTDGSGFSVNRFADGSVIEVSTKIHVKGFM